MGKMPPLYLLWAGLSLAAIALFAEGVRGTSRVSGVAVVPPSPAPAAVPIGPTGALSVPAPPPTAGPQETRTVPTLPPIPPPPPDAGPPPKIRFASESVDFGTILQGAEPTQTFSVQNTGAGLLRIIDIAAGCGCAAILPDRREIPAGGSGEIQVTFKSGSYEGPQHKTVTVRCNDPEMPVVMLHLRANVKPMFVFDPPLLNFGEMERGSEKTMEVTVRETQGKPFTLESVTANQPGTRAEALPEAGGDGVTRRLRVTCRAEGNPGGFVSQVILRVNRPNVVPAIVVQGFFQGNVSIFPQAVFMGMVQPGQSFVPQALSVRNRGNVPVEITSVETGVPWLKAEVKTITPQQVYQIDLIVDPLPPPGRFEQVVKIHTSDPPPPYVITVSGVVRKAEGAPSPPGPGGAAPPKPQ
jgi:hypothetical protein